MLLSGSVRLIDQSRTFGHLTLGKIDSPQIFGIEELLSVTASIDVRCATQCGYILIDPITLTEEQKQQSREILTNKINSTESVSIYSSISNTFPEATQPWKTFKDVLNSTVLLHSQSEANSADVIIYLDAARDGFTYGQIITPEICSSFFIEKAWPRIAGIQLRDEINLRRASETAKQASAPPSPIHQVLDKPQSSLKRFPTSISRLTHKSRTAFESFGQKRNKHRLLAA